MIRPKRVPKLSGANSDAEFVHNCKPSPLRNPKSLFKGATSMMQLEDDMRGEGKDFGYGNSYMYILMG